LRGTVNQGLIYPINKDKRIKEEFEITAFSDADWGGIADKRSTAGMLTYMERRLIFWRAKVMKTIATSTTHAELQSILLGIKQIQWTITLVDDVGCKVKLPIELFNDNAAAVQIANNYQTSEKTKHIAIMIAAIRDATLETETVKVVYCPTEKMLADLLTKPVAPVKARELMKGIFECRKPDDYNVKTDNMIMCNDYIVR
jgi:hypothetical protein